MKKLLVGLLGGLSLGMLFAPEKGSSLREKLAKSDHKLKDFGDVFLAAGKDASGEVKTFIDSKEVQELLKKGNIDTDALLEKGKALSEKGKEEVKNMIAKAKDKKEGFFSKNA